MCYNSYHFAYLYTCIFLFSSCCASRFTWASTSNSLAQEVRDKHNCRACGKLVCGPCSENRTSLPDMGLDVAQLRVCDKCYFNTMGKKTNNDSMTRSFCAENEVEPTLLL